MRKIAITFVLLVFSMVAVCQQKFSKAKITTISGNVIDCYIKSMLDENTPQKFEYNLDQGSAVTRIDINEIDKVEFEDGIVYENHRIKTYIVSEPFLTRTQSFYDQPGSFYDGRALLEKLVSGKISLYQFVDKYNFSHFFYKTDEMSEVELLENKTYVEDAEMHNDFTYKNQLLFLTKQNGCPAYLDKQIDVLQHAVNPMIRIFKKLNECAGGPVNINNKNYGKGAKIRFGLLAGGAYTNVNFTVANPYYAPGLTDDKFPGSVGPALGVYFEVLPMKKIRNYSFSLEVFYHSYNAETDSIQANSYTTGKGRIKFSTLNFQPNIKVLLTRDKIAPFLEAGIDVVSILSREDRFEYIASGTKYSYPIFTQKGTAMGFAPGAGVNTPWFSLHARYQVLLGGVDPDFKVLYIMAKVHFQK